MSSRVPEQSSSHAGLLDESQGVPTHAQFDAIVVPTCRPVKNMWSCINLAGRTQTPLIVVCSREIGQDEVIERADLANVEAFAFDLPPGNPLGIDFATSDDKELANLSRGWNRDLSIKRNTGLVLAQLLGWKKLMFLDDDIYVTEEGMASLAAALEDHTVSALIPENFPDNSVVCHAHRLGGGEQDVFASASGIGVRCDRDDLAFFPNIYNEDWFFFAEEAASHKIAKVGVSHQNEYDPYSDPDRAAREEFGDLLAEGLYARLDRGEGIRDVDTDYWRDFIKERMAFHERVAEALDHVEDRDKKEAARARNSIHAAQDQLSRIRPEVCQRFMQLWQVDLENWRSYLADLPRSDSLAEAFKYLDIAPASCRSSNQSNRTG